MFSIADFGVGQKWSIADLHSSQNIPSKSNVDYKSRLHCTDKNAEYCIYARKNEIKRVYKTLV